MEADIVITVQYSPRYAYCSCSVPGALGFMVFSTLTSAVTITLVLTLTLAEQLLLYGVDTGGTNKDLEEAMLWHSCATIGWDFEAADSLNLWDLWFS